MACEAPQNSAPKIRLTSVPPAATRRVSTLAGIRVVLKIVFGECPEAHQLRAIGFEKAKIS